MQEKHRLALRWLFIFLAVAVCGTDAASGVVFIDSATILHSSMTVKWQYSPPNNWSVESYTVCWKKAGTLSGTCGSGGLGLSPVTIASSATDGSYSVTNLPDADDKYKFKVKANIVKNSNSNKKKTKTVGTVKEFTNETPAPADPDDCPSFGPVGQLYAEPTGETTMKLTWEFHPDCGDWASPINSMTICWERKGNLKGICGDNEGTISDPAFAAGYNVDGLKPCKRYRFKLWGNYDNGKKEIGTTTMRTQCPPKMMITDNSDCAEEGVSLCLPSLNNDAFTFGELQEQLTDTIFGNITSILEAPTAQYEGILRGIIEEEAIAAVETSAVYKNLKVGQLATPRDSWALRRELQGVCQKAEEQDPLTKEEIREVARVSYFLRDAVDFITDDLATAIDEELYADLAYAIERNVECGIERDPCGPSTPRNPPDDECLQMVPEITKDEASGDIADAVEDLYDRFDTSDCDTECTETSLQDVLLVQMMEGEVSENGCPKMGVVSGRGQSSSSLLATGTFSNLYDKGR